MKSSPCPPPLPDRGEEFSALDRMFGEFLRRTAGAGELPCRLGMEAVRARRNGHSFIPVTPEEEEALRALGVRPLNLGEWVLRLETAALCGLAVLRKFLSVFILIGVAVFLCGGCGREAARHPLVRKGDYCRDTGDAKAALNFYRRALEKYPNSPVLYMRLAILYDESLNDPLAAAWYYSEYLRVDPESPERETVEACRRAALERLRQMDENTIRQAAETEKLRQRVRQLETERRRLIQAAKEAAQRETPHETPAGKKPGEKARR